MDILTNIVFYDILSVDKRRGVMPTKNINLTKHYNIFVENEIKGGYYNNASEVIRAGIHLLERQKLEDVAKLKALQEAGKIGFKDIDDGKYIQLNSEQKLSKFFSDIDVEINQ